MVKAYEMMSCFEGLIEFYRVTGIEKWKTAFVHFVHFVLESDVTIIGCSGCTHELFDHSSVRQANTKYDGVVQETCVTVTWLKTCYQMLCLTGDAKFADSMELSYYNAMLGAVNTEASTANGGFPFDSYSPLVYGKRGRKVGGYKVMEGGQAYGCCACIGSAELAAGVLSSVMASKTGLVFLQYFSGLVHTKTPSSRKITLEIDTSYPAKGNVRITVRPDQAEQFTLAFRIPQWSKRAVGWVNGLEGQVEAGEYFTVSRCWENGDIVMLEFDMRTAVLYAPDYKDDPAAKRHIALKRGPVILARDQRFGEDLQKPVKILTDEEGFAIVSPSCDATFRRNQEFLVYQVDARPFHAVDYSSAGKDWNSYIAAWLPWNSEIKG